MKFTNSEWEIIEHRLGVPGAIADALEDEYNREAVEAKAEELRRSGGDIDFEELSKMGKDIIIDCLDGSTFFADIYDEHIRGYMSKGKFLSYHKARNSLERKLDIQIPQ